MNASERSAYANGYTDMCELVIGDLRRRAAIMRASRGNGRMKRTERAALYIAERALLRAAEDYEQREFLSS